MRHAWVTIQMDARAGSGQRPQLPFLTIFLFTPGSPAMPCPLPSPCAPQPSQPLGVSTRPVQQQAGSG